MLLELWQRFISAREQLVRRMGRAARLLPWLSFAYGIISGVYLARDYGNSTKLLAYLGLLVVVQSVLRLALRTRPQLARGLAIAAHQYAIQYILMFTIPLLFVAKAWLTLGVTALFAGTALWDRWWVKLATFDWYMTLMRTLAATLAASFSFAVLFPKFLGAFHPVLGVVAVISAFPWIPLLTRRRPPTSAVIPFAIVTLAVSFQAWSDRWVRFPLLSVGLARPGFGVGVRDHELVERFSREMPHARLEELLRSHQELCCFTPIVSPSGLSAGVVHEWRADGKRIDRITLPEIRGRGDDKSFRTFSCKKHLPPAESTSTLSCHVLLLGDLPIGSVEVRFVR